MGTRVIRAYRSLLSTTGANCSPRVTRSILSSNLKRSLLRWSDVSGSFRTWWGRPNVSPLHANHSTKDRNRVRRREEKDTWRNMAGQKGTMYVIRRSKATRLTRDHWLRYTTRRSRRKSTSPCWDKKMRQRRTDGSLSPNRPISLSKFFVDM